MKLSPTSWFHRSASAGSITSVARGLCAAALLLLAASATRGAVVVKWTDNAVNEEGFRIERAPGTSTTFATAGTVAADVTSFTDSTVPDTTVAYTYRVTAYNASGDSGFTNTLTVNPPTITPPANLTINQGTSTGALSFTVGSTDVAATSLTVTAASGNTTLVPNANITLGGSGTSRTVSITPVAGQHGTATITLTVSDGGLTAVGSFTLTVNGPPSIASVGAQSVPQNGTLGPITLTVSDPETAAGSLILSATTSNGTLLPTSGISFGNSGGVRTVTIVPATGQSGTANVTVTVSDGSLTASTTFAVTVGAPPTVSAISTQTINMGSGTSAIGFTIGDPDTAIGSLTLSASSSNTTLVPNANIVLGGSGTSRTVTVTPAAGQSGTVTITVSVSDGGNTTTSSFQLVVNAPPTIGTVAAQLIGQGATSAPIPVTVGDPDTPLTSLALTASSSNTTLVPNANLVVGGSGANRTLTITGAAGQSGTSTITLTVSDGSLTASTSFVLTVDAAPTISAIGSQAVNQGSATSAIAFTVGDADTALGSLTLTGASSNTALVTTGGIVFGGSGANRTVTLTPVAGQTGTTTITVTVSDGIVSASTSFTLTVNAPPTLGAVQNVDVYQDGNSGPISLTVGDAETSAAALTLTGTSGNTTLLPNSGITFGGTGANRTMTITPAAGQNGTTTVTLSLSDGSATTTATVNVKVWAPGSTVAPTITPQPSPTQSVTAGGTATFSSGATGTPMPTYQWKKDGVAIPGATNASLTLTSVTSANAGIYTLTASSLAGSVTSQNSVLTVVSAPVGTAPTISTPPQSLTRTVGTSATFTVTAAGTAPLTYRWRLNEAFIAGATDATFTIPSVKASDAGVYDVMVSNSAGLVTSSGATLTVITGPAITTQPVGGTYTAGGNATLSVVATGTTPLNYQWAKGGSALSGKTAATLTLSNLTPADAGDYTVTVTNAGGSVTSTVATIVVNKRSFAGAYFGTLSGGGTWALYVRADNTGTYIAYLSDRRTAIVTDVTVDQNGTFSASGTELGTITPSFVHAESVGGSTAHPATIAAYTLTGSIANGAVTGQLSGIGQSVTGSADTGGTAAAGFYKASATNADNGNSYVVVGGSGKALAVTTSASTVDSASGTVGANGQLTAKTTAGASLSVTINPQSQVVAATYTPSGSTTPVQYSGIETSIPVTSRLVNISARSMVAAGDSTLIAGFVISGSSAKSVLVRGIGPTLADYGIPTGFLADPTAGIYSGQTAIATNDDWASSNATGISTAATNAGAFSLPASSKDAALLTTVNAGGYTAMVSAKGTATGIALIEVYDTAKGSDARFINVSARTQVGTDSNVLILGFAIEGNASRQFLVRAVGPTLASLNVSGVLTDPQLDVVRQTDHVVLAHNDNWGGTAALKAAANSVGAFAIPDTSKDAAVVVTLDPGSYTAVVSGVGSTTGIALIELYQLP